MLNFSILVGLTKVFVNEDPLMMKLVKDLSYTAKTGADRVSNMLQPGRCRPFPRQGGSFDGLLGQLPPVPPATTIGLHHFHR